MKLGLVCAGDQQGVLVFAGDNLQEMRFYTGAFTDRGVWTGSTLAELREAYGARLKPVEPFSFVSWFQAAVDR